MDRLVRSQPDDTDPLALGIQRWRLHFAALDPIHLPDYPGSTWRGAFGHALRRVSCLNGSLDCDDCALRAHCIYAQVFEPQANDRPAQAPSHLPGQGFQDPPRPYALHPPWLAPSELAPEQDYALEFSLFGQAAPLSALALRAFAEAGMAGIGKQRGRLLLQGIEPIELPLRPSSPPSTPIRLILQTPLRLHAKGKPAGPNQLRLYDLALALTTRLAWLAPARPLDREQILTEASDTPLQDAQLHRVDWQRYSSRQDQHIPRGGLLGQITLPAPASHFPTLWPLLWLGQFLHVGKGAVMGMGRYEIAMKNFSNRPEPTLAIDTPANSTETDRDD